MTTPAWLHAVPTCPSTNSLALEQLAQYEHGDAVWTERQTAGRGQHGRGWTAPPGVLTVSFIIDVPGETLPWLSLLAGLGLVRWVDGFQPAEPVWIKWPNDCYIGRSDPGKLAGILCEMRRAAGHWRAVVGIGCNLDPRWQAAERQQISAGVVEPASLRDCGITPPSPLTAIAGLRTHLLPLFEDPPAAPDLVRLLGERDWLRDRHVTVTTPAGSRSGIACGIDQRGRLLLREDGSSQPQPIEAGSVRAG